MDCKKSVVWKCVTPAEKKLEDAIKDYNKAIDEVDRLKKLTEQLAHEGEVHSYNLNLMFQQYYANYDQMAIADQEYVKVATLPDRLELLRQANELKEVQNQSLANFEWAQGQTKEAKTYEIEASELLIKAKEAIKKAGDELSKSNVTKNKAEELKKNFLKKMFGYLARCEFWAKIGLRFWILVG